MGGVAVLALAAWMFVLPAGFESVRGLNLRATQAWLGVVGRATTRPPAAVSLATARAVFRILTTVGWLAYGGMAWCVFRGARFGRRWTWPVAAPLVLLLAVALPAVLSPDVFAYVGYGRLAVVHGLNPHLHTQTELIELGDPTAPYLHWPIASPYGPLWTLISMVVVRLAPPGAVLGPVIVLKVLAGGALLAAAEAARRLVARAAPERADATFVLVAMNPLLLLEGPGSGHNDIVMIALVMVALANLTRSAGPVRPGPPRRAILLSALLVGAAAAIKLVPLVLVPWLALVAMRAEAPRWRTRAAVVALTAAVALIPVVGSYAPFWEGTRTLAGLRQRWSVGVRAPTAASSPPATSPAAPAAASRPAPSHGGQGRFPWSALAQSWPALLSFLWATGAVAFGKGEPIFRLATVWGVVSLALMMFVTGIWFPWYLAWTWPASVVRFTRLHLVLTGFLLAFSLMLMVTYALPPG